MSSNPSWIKLPSVPFGAIYGTTIGINRDEILVVSGPNKSQPASNSVTDKYWSGIHKFNSKSNEWTKFIEYEKDFELVRPGGTFDAKEQIVYLYGHNYQMCILFKNWNIKNTA